MEVKYKPVNIDNVGGNESFVDNNKVWKISSLREHVKSLNLEVFELPLCSINLATSVWEKGNLEIKNFAKHWERASQADLNYPIILDDDGFIMDGWHRVAKALFLRLPTIKAVRFDITPECDFTQV